VPSDATVAARQVRYEQLIFWRNPAGAFFAIILPVIFLVIFGIIFGNQTVFVNNHWMTYNDFFVPALVAYGILGACLTNLAMTLSIRRDNGLLKRLRGTPMPVWAFIAGLIGSCVLVAIVLTAFTTVFGVLVYHLTPPQHIGATVLALAVGAIVFCALGVAITVAIPNADAAPAIVNAIVLPLVFISGTFFPIDPTSVVAKIAEYFPVRHLINAMYLAFDPVHTSSTGIDGSDYLVMGIWGAAALLIALRNFRWEPRRV
jgi:ABC-2 type transport system permease protein